MPLPSLWPPSRRRGLLKESIDVGAMLDTSFVDKLQASGFIQQSYAK